MKEIKIFYHSALDPDSPYKLGNIYERKFDELKKEGKNVISGIKIKKLTFETKCKDLIENFEKDNYNIVIIHLGGEHDAYEEADKIRKLSRDVLIIAESSIWPSGKNEVLEHFDGYYKDMIIPWLKDRDSSILERLLENLKSTK